MNILMIEDDHDILANLHDILEKDGHYVESFGTLAEVFEHGNLSDFSVILLDRKLPDGMAEKYLPRLRTVVPEAAVIILTNYADLDAVIEAMHHGAVDFILKPINPERLRLRLGRIAKLREAEQRALQAERLAAIGQMLTVLSHESRNALNQIQLSLTTLPLIVTGLPDALAQVAVAQEALKRLGQLFNDLRGYAAPIVLRCEKHNVAEILTDAWNSLLPLHKNRLMRLNKGEASVCCEVDRPRLEQVFRNILENALAACRDPAEITWHLCVVQQANQAVVRIVVRDNGPGLSAEQKRKVFDPFYTTKPDGTGLGMAICKRIVEAHGGEIAVESVPGQGAEFIITLPLR
jgi:signal transduction histidine kinase